MRVTLVFLSGDYVTAKDPDILISTNQHFESTNVDYLFKKMSTLALDLGRESSLPNHINKINGIKGNFSHTIFCKNKSK
jgi:hypothetical protein